MRREKAVTEAGISAGGYHHILTITRPPITNPCSIPWPLASCRGRKAWSTNSIVSMFLSVRWLTPIPLNIPMPPDDGMSVSLTLHLTASWWIYAAATLAFRLQPGASLMAAHGPIPAVHAFSFASVMPAPSATMRLSESETWHAKPTFRHKYHAPSMPVTVPANRLSRFPEPSVILPVGK